MDAFIGTIFPVVFDYAPDGWLQCDGRTLKVSNYPALYAVLVNTYGGDNVNFKLPDLRGRVIVGTGQAPGLSQYARGATVGKESVTLTTAQLPQHRHELMGSTSIATRAAPNGASVVAATGSASDAVTALGTPIYGDAGNGAPVDIRQPSFALNYIICVYGEFPVRPT